MRDYIHVSDLADAHVKALGSLECASPSRAYNLGNGRGFSVRKVIDTVERVIGLRVPAKLGGRGDPARLISDASRARAELRWEPRIADLDQIISSSWAWHQRRVFERGTRRLKSVLSGLTSLVQGGHR